VLLLLQVSVRSRPATDNRGKWGITLAPC
jgi:hypothetical protein